MTDTHRSSRAAIKPPAAGKQNSLPASQGTAKKGSEYSTESLHQGDLASIAAQLLGSGKLALSLDELVRAIPFSRRTIRRFELKGELVALKATRTKAFLVSDVLSFLQRIR